jgi:formylglycine-generating enzyme required for sulfatase activity
MGEVYLAQDQVLERPVAIKFVHLSDPGPASASCRGARGGPHPAPERDGDPPGRRARRHPYLICEYIRGSSLADLQLPLPEPQVRELAVGLARGLAAAHRQGVLHRDIKLANVMLDEGGVVKLLDFSLAKILDAPPPASSRPIGPRDPTPLPLDGTTIGSPHEVTGEGTLIGTPNYMAPELWQARPATRSSDVYALGVVLYSLCCGQPPTIAGSAAQLAELVQEAEPPPLLARARVDPAFAAIVDRCIRRRAEERFASGEELRAALEALAPARGDGQAAAGNPYRGLRAFEAEHRDRFFGRTGEILAVVDRMRGQPFVLVAGDSGVGKSSLCRAGVLPRISDGALAGGRTWRSVTLTPGRDPVRALVDGLGLALGLLVPGLGPLVDDGDALERRITRAVGATRGCVLFIDQLEELVTLAAPSEASRAARLLARLEGMAGVRLLATARGDFLTRIAQVPGFGEELPRSLYFLPPLGAEGLRQAIVGPAQAQGLRFESEALVDRLVTAGIEGSLPLLQFALGELWEARDPGSATITTAALDRIGGVDGALARHADSVIARLTAPQRRAARALLLRLVTVEDTRASLAADELQTGDEAQRAALEALVAARLLVVRDAPDGPVHEIAHEALIRGWLTLQIWLDEERETRAARHRLATAAGEWDRLGRPPDALWNARQLAETAALGPAGLHPRELGFLAAGRARVRRRRRLRWLAALSVPVAALALLLGFRLARAADVDRRVAEHRGAAAEAVAQARAEDADVMARRAAAFAAFDARDREAGEAAWQQALAAEPNVLRLYDRAARELESALRLDGARGELRGEFADVLLAQAEIAEREHQAAQVETLTARVALYDEDGGRLARWRAPAELTITSEPPGASVTVQAYVDEAGRRVPGEPRSLGVTPISGEALAAGSYLLTFTAEGAATVRLPLLLGRGEVLAIAPELPPAERVPAGFVAIPAGRFQFGAAADEDLRKGFLSAVPMHEASTDAYLIARHETTYAEWIEFLEGLPPAERATRTPGGGPGGFHQVAALAQLGPGAWQLRMAKGELLLTARSDEPLVYPTRKTRAAQDWLRMPVTGIDWADAAAYLEWLDRTGRVPGARFCSELEWERAARGADGRRFPTGDRVGPDDANYDETYGRDFAAMGPDEVGSFPASDSPFGVQDMLGNVFEWTTSALAGEEADEKVARGGGFFFGAPTGYAMNRAVFSADFRDGSLGLRVCAPAIAGR